MIEEMRLTFRQVHIKMLCAFTLSRVQRICTVEAPCILLIRLDPIQSRGLRVTPTKHTRNHYQYKHHLAIITPPWNVNLIVDERYYRQTKVQRLVSEAATYLMARRPRRWPLGENCSPSCWNKYTSKSPLQSTNLFGGSLSSETTLAR